MLKTVYRSSCRDKHNCQQCDANLDPLTPQSDVLTTRPLRPANIPGTQHLTRKCNLCCSWEQIFQRGDSGIIRQRSSKDNAGKQFTIRIRKVVTRCLYQPLCNTPLPQHSALPSWTTNHIIFHLPISFCFLNSYYLCLQCSGDVG